VDTICPNLSLWVTWSSKKHKHPAFYHSMGIISLIIAMSFLIALAIMPVCLEWWETGVDYDKCEEFQITYQGEYYCRDSTL